MPFITLVRWLKGNARHAGHSHARRPQTFWTSRLEVEELEARVTPSSSCNRVVIDPGHGGTQPGASSPTGLLEKAVALDLGLRLRSHLQSRGFEVTMTRTTDVDVGISARAQVAAGLIENQQHVFFLSIHLNANESPTIRGTETFVRAEANDNVNLQEDTTFANYVQASTYSVWQPRGGRSRGVKPDTQSQFPAGLGVLNDADLGNTQANHPVVSALVEVEFLTNPTVDSDLRQTQLLDTLAASMAQGIERARNALCNPPSVVEVIDRSGSMAGNKIAAAKTAASLFVDLMNPGDKIGVVSYSTSASVNFPLTAITTDSTVKTQARAAINSLVASGGTSIGAGVAAADNQLDRFPGEQARAMIVMTDGLHNTAPDPIAVINAQVDPNIRIFTIGFGSDADTARLTQMAALRNGGFFFAPSNAELQQIYASLAGEISGQQQALNTFGNVQPGQQTITNFSVDPSAVDLTVGLNWAGSDLDLELVAPDGTVINHMTAVGNPNVELVVGATFEFYKIRLPQDGQWQARVIAIDVPAGGEPYNLFARMDSAVVASIETRNSAGIPTLSFQTGDLVNVRVRLSDVSPIRGASVVVSIRPPSGAPSSVVLYDDGAHNDGAANDGVYGNNFQALVAGTHTLQVDAQGTATLGFAFTRAPTASILVTQGPVVTQADLSITQTASPNPVLTGSNLTYTLTVRNNGPSAATSVTVTDNLPASLTFVSGTATGGGVLGGTGNNRTVTFASLAPGASATITLAAAVNCAVPNGTVISNTATVSSPTPDPVSGNNSATVTVTASNPPPVISAAAVDRSVLWPPNHRMVDVAVNYTVTDNCGTPSITLGITSNEPVNGTGDGDTAPDWEVVDGHHVRLRAERAGNGNGRTYTITITATDSAGGSSSRTVTVTVPRDQGQPLTAAQAGGRAAEEVLTEEQVAPLLNEAIARWRAAGLDTEGLSTIIVQLTDLPGSLLGLAGDDIIWLDLDAAGHGWFIDPTPVHDEEFPAGEDSAASGRMDLLTVLAHELGHLLGFKHGDEEDVMGETLDVGVRHTPGSAKAILLDDLVDLVLNDNWWQRKQVVA